MQLKRNEMYKISFFFFVIDDMITQEKIQKLFFFLVGGGYIAKVLKLAVNHRNTHWLEKSLTTVDDKPWKLFCKTSLNARE